MHWYLYQLSTVFWTKVRELPVPARDFKMGFLQDGPPKTQRPKMCHLGPQKNLIWSLF